MKAAAGAVLLILVIVGIVVMSHLALRNGPPAAPLSIEEIEQSLGIEAE